MTICLRSATVWRSSSRARTRISTLRSRRASSVATSPCSLLRNSSPMFCTVVPSSATRRRSKTIWTSGWPPGRARTDVGQPGDGVHAFDRFAGQQIEGAQTVAADFHFYWGAEGKISGPREFELEFGDVSEKIAHCFDGYLFADFWREPHVEVGGVLLFVRGRAAGLGAAADEGKDRGDAIETAHLPINGGNLGGGLLQRGARAPFEIDEEFALAHLWDQFQPEVARPFED